MRIAILAAGAAGMYCGSCMRDNALARALIRMGEEVLLIPLYTPLRVDGEDVSSGSVFYGGINLYLQEKLRFFRRTPRIIDRIFDSRLLLNFTSKLAGMTKPEDLGALTISTLRAEDGPQVKEVARLAAWLADDFKPHIINLPNAMFAGAVRTIKRDSRAVVLCSLSGEDLFLEGLTEPYKSQALALLKESLKDVDGFIAISAYYADFVSQYLDIPREKIDVVYSGINLEGFGPRVPRPREPFTIGYLARIAPEKGLHILIEALRLLREMSGAENAQVRAAGWMGPRERTYLTGIQRKLRDWKMEEAFTYVGEVTLKEKLEFLDTVSVLSVPTVYRDPKGLFVLEALAHGIPVVQPAHGAFPEWIALTGGGVLFEPENPADLAAKLYDLMQDREKADRLAMHGRQVVGRLFTDQQMALNTLEVYRKYMD